MHSVTRQHDESPPPHRGAPDNGPAEPPKRGWQVSPAVVQRAIARHSFCTLATSSRRNRPHITGVLYCTVDGRLYISTGATTRKVRNVRENAHVAVCIPVRKYPVGPPFCVQFEGLAEVLAPQHPEIAALLPTARLKTITGYGTLAEPDLCFIRITPARIVSTYGVGVPLLAVLRDPLHANGRAELTEGA